MKRFYKMTLVLGMLVAATSASAGMGSIFDGGWRISAGAVYDSGVKTDMRFSPQQTYVSPYARATGALTRDQAREAASGKTSGTRTTYVNTRNGATSYIDKDDPGYEHDGKTFNYRFPAAVWDGNKSFELGYAEYEEFSSEQSSFNAMSSSASEEACMPGVTIQLSRNLYHNETYNWGLEAAFAFQYARRTDVIKASSSWLIGRSSKTTGGYASTYTASGELAEVLPGSRSDPDLRDILWGADDAIGGDFYAIRPGDVKSSEWGGTTVTDAQYGSLDAHGDYDNMELMFLLQPYYDIFSWLSVNATLGLVVSRQDMEMTFAMLRNGVSEYYSNRDFSQWDAYGIAGLGLMVTYKNFTLSGDFLARLWTRDMDIDDTYYHGTVGRGDWMFRLCLGYEF